MLLGIFLEYELIAGGIWKGDILIADLEDLETLDAPDIYPRRIKAKEALISHKEDEFELPIAQMVLQTCEEETTNSEIPL